MKVFIAGPRAIKNLDENINNKLENICKEEHEILIGDADGIDSCVQKFLNGENYRNVRVYASKGKVRNNYGNWNVQNVYVEDGITGFEFYAKKDLAMAQNADIGFMIWNGKSKGTFTNMVNLLNLGKKVVMYYNNKFYYFKDKEQLINFINSNIKLDSKLKKILGEKEEHTFIQACLF